LLANSPFLILAKNAVPANDLTGLIAWLKANPDKALFGSAGVGSPPHIGGVLFQELTDTRIQFTIAAALQCSRI
jgi:tripartite-type tricarboxylate transporter receptor subunit TctC